MRFSEVNTWQEYLKNLNESLSEERFFIKEKTFTYCLFNKSDKYLAFSIPKKAGGTRDILAPKKSLKFIQRSISNYLQDEIEFRPAAHGFIRKRSIITNAKLHRKRRFVYNLDLKEFFPSIHFGRVKAVLKLEPFKMSDEAARITATLCCREGVLPQGSPASPVISNLVAQKLDRKLMKLSKKYKFTYSRYADDLTFSSNIDVFNEGLIRNIHEIIESEGFELNNKKERLLYNSSRQEVTGLVVNKKVNVTKEYYRNLRSAIHSFLTQPLDTAVAKYAASVGRKMDHIEAYASIRGKIDYCGQVLGKDNKKYLELMFLYSLIANDLKLNRKISETLKEIRQGERVVFLSKKYEFEVMEF